MTDFDAFKLLYIVASVFFIAGIKMFHKPDTARRGNTIAAVGMLIAVIGTLLISKIISFEWIIVGLIIGSVIGVLSARLIAMTAMPEMVALQHACGAAACLLVGYSEFHAEHGLASLMERFAIISTILISTFTFSGSLIAYGKLSGLIRGNLSYLPGQHIINYSLLLISCALAGYFLLPSAMPYEGMIALSIIPLALIFGITAVIPVGGGNMPIIISILNSMAGLSAAGAGFVLNNTLLIVTGSLVSASGFVLAASMCKAMNRSMRSVALTGFERITTNQTAAGIKGEAKAISIEDAYAVLEAARTVLIVPGYGLAVAQAQHAVKELATLLEANGAEVNFAIHPVAGRMPGHMNVLLAEANVSYDKLLGPEDVNGHMNTVDLCIVIGANDVVNPMARDVPDCPIYGMPIIEVDKAHNVFVLKRSMDAGFSGIDNPLFFKENTRMVFGNAKETLSALAAEFKKH